MVVVLCVRSHVSLAVACLKTEQEWKISRLKNDNSWISFFLSSENTLILFTQKYQCQFLGCLKFINFLFGTNKN